MKLFKKVAIIGTGLIGGSLAMAIRKRGLAGSVVGISRHARSIRTALRLGAIDAGSQDLEIARDADLVIFCGPVGVILKQAPVLGRLVGAECIVSDVGSTKSEIVKFLGRIFPRFVGAHPLAGSEKRGIDNADAGLFGKSLCLLTPTPKTERAALNKVKSLWVALGARVASFTPEEHDRVLGFVSHLPHAAAYSLINSIPAPDLKFAASGLKDSTRIAASDPGLWADIFLSNAGNLERCLGRLQQNLHVLSSALARKDRAKILRILTSASRKRSSL